MGNFADEAHALFNQVVDEEYPKMQKQREAMLVGVPRNLGIEPSGEKFTGSQAGVGVPRDKSLDGPSV